MFGLWCPSSKFHPVKIFAATNPQADLFLVGSKLKLTKWLGMVVRPLYTYEKGLSDLEPKDLTLLLELKWPEVLQKWLVRLVLWEMRQDQRTVLLTILMNLQTQSQQHLQGFVVDPRTVSESVEDRKSAQFSAYIHNLLLAYNYFRKSHSSVKQLQVVAFMANLSDPNEQIQVLTYFEKCSKGLFNKLLWFFQKFELFPSHQRILMLHILKKNDTDIGDYLAWLRSKNINCEDKKVHFTFYTKLSVNCLSEWLDVFISVIPENRIILLKKCFNLRKKSLEALGCFIFSLKIEKSLVFIHKLIKYPTPFFIDISSIFNDKEKSTNLWPILNHFKGYVVPSRLLKCYSVYDENVCKMLTTAMMGIAEEHGELFFSHYDDITNQSQLVHFFISIDKHSQAKLLSVLNFVSESFKTLFIKLLLLSGSNPLDIIVDRVHLLGKDEIQQLAAFAHDFPLEECRVNLELFVKFDHTCTSDLLLLMTMYSLKEQRQIKNLFENLEKSEAGPFLKWLCCKKNFNKQNIQRGIRILSNFDLGILKMLCNKILDSSDIEGTIRILEYLFQTTQSINYLTQVLSQLSSISQRKELIYLFKKDSKSDGNQITKYLLNVGPHYIARIISVFQSLSYESFIMVSNLLRIIPDSNMSNLAEVLIENSLCSIEEFLILIQKFTWSLSLDLILLLNKASQESRLMLFNLIARRNKNPVDPTLLHILRMSKAINMDELSQMLKYLGKADVSLNMCVEFLKQLEVSYDDKICREEFFTLVNCHGETTESLEYFVNAFGLLEAYDHIAMLSFLNKLNLQDQKRVLQLFYARNILEGDKAKNQGNLSKVLVNIGLQRLFYTINLFESIQDKDDALNRLVAFILNDSKEVVSSTIEIFTVLQKVNDGTEFSLLGDSICELLFVIFDLTWESSIKSDLVQILSKEMVKAQNVGKRLFCHATDVLKSIKNRTRSIVKFIRLVKEVSCYVSSAMSFVPTLIQLVDECNDKVIMIHLLSELELDEVVWCMDRIYNFTESENVQFWKNINNWEFRSDVCVSWSKKEEFFNIIKGNTCIKALNTKTSELSSKQNDKFPIQISKPIKIAQHLDIPPNGFHVSLDHFPKPKTAKYKLKNHSTQFNLKDIYFKDTTNEYVHPKSTDTEDHDYVAVNCSKRQSTGNHCKCISDNILPQVEHVAEAKLFPEEISRNFHTTELFNRTSISRSKSKKKAPQFSNIDTLPSPTKLSSMESYTSMSNNPHEYLSSEIDISKMSTRKCKKYRGLYCAISQKTNICEAKTLNYIKADIINLAKSNHKLELVKDDMKKLCFSKTDEAKKQVMIARVNKLIGKKNVTLSRNSSCNSGGVVVQQGYEAISSAQKLRTSNLQASILYSKETIN